MKIKAIPASYEQVAAIPAEKHFQPMKPSMFFRLVMKVAFQSTKDLETFVGHVQTYGTTQTQVVFSTMIEPREIVE